MGREERDRNAIPEHIGSILGRVFEQGRESMKKPNADDKIRASMRRKNIRAMRANEELSKEKQRLLDHNRHLNHEIGLLNTSLGILQQEKERLIAGVAELNLKLKAAVDSGDLKKVQEEYSAKLEHEVHQMEKKLDAQVLLRAQLESVIAVWERVFSDVMKRVIPLQDIDSLMGEK
jgi:hypothetical protein